MITQIIIGLLIGLSGGFFNPTAENHLNQYN